MSGRFDSGAAEALRALVAAADAAAGLVALAVDERRQEVEDRLGVRAGDDVVLDDPGFGPWLDRYGVTREVAEAARQALAAWPAVPAGAAR